MGRSSSAQVVVIFACSALAACSRGAKEEMTNNRGSARPTQATPVAPASTPSPAPGIEPLKVPERVAAGEVTERGEAQVPPHLQNDMSDPSHGGLKILFRRQSGNVRLTVFDGAHDKNTEAAFRWLNQQRRSK